jgi:undecaprenyl-diphosphatase
VIAGPRRSGASNNHGNQETADMTLLLFLQIIILAIVQGLAELLPVSSSAHVIVAEKLLGLDPSNPAMTLLLAMLHTGTMFAVILYFWRAWKRTFFASFEQFKWYTFRLAVATALTAIVGWPLIKGIEKAAQNAGYAKSAVEKDLSRKDAGPQLDTKAGPSSVRAKAGVAALSPKDEGTREVDVEELFGNLALVGGALAAAGVLILIAGLLERRAGGTRPIEALEAAWIGFAQGLCLPFRGFSRSGATISVGLLLGGVRARVEEFSFALAVIITPAAIIREALRAVKKHHEAGGSGVPLTLFTPSLVGMVLAFLAGLWALKWLSRWLEAGRWYLFGIYCLLAASAVFFLHFRGY